MYRLILFSLIDTVDPRHFQCLLFRQTGYGRADEFLLHGGEMNFVPISS